MPTTRRIDSVLYAAAMAGLAVLVGTIGFALLYRSRLTYQINYNEGWNSYFTARVLDGLALHPDRASRLINNYPPVSFYVTALVAKLTGSVLVAGRALAWLGYLGCATVIGLNVRRMGANLAGAAFGTMFFAAALATRCELYVGMFDPQLFAQFIMVTGLLVLVSRTTAIGAASAAALIVLGGFIKHSLIALPISATIWLALYHRKVLVPWLLASIVSVAAGLAAAHAAFGPGFAAGLAVPRHTSLPGAVAKMLRWLLPLELPCVLATLPALLGPTLLDSSRDRQGGVFALTYLVIALVTGLAGAAPLGTNYNMIFELLVATSLGLGLLVGSPAPRVPSGWVALAACASLFITALQLGTAETSNWQTWSAAQRVRDADARATIRLIRDTPGDALCGTLLLCFEAGKPMAYDPLNVGQAPGETQADLQCDLTNQRFALVQLDPASAYLNEASLRALHAAYREVPDHSGIFAPELETTRYASAKKTCGG